VLRNQNKTDCRKEKSNLGSSARKKRQKVERLRRGKHIARGIFRGETKKNRTQESWGSVSKNGST